jgi:hypothetical protein
MPMKNTGLLVVTSTTECSFSDREWATRVMVALTCRNLNGLNGYEKTLKSNSQGH